MQQSTLTTKQGTPHHAPAHMHHWQNWPSRLNWLNNAMIHTNGRLQKFQTCRKTWHVLIFKPVPVAHGLEHHWRLIVELKCPYLVTVCCMIARSIYPYLMKHHESGAHLYCGFQPSPVQNPMLPMPISIFNISPISVIYNIVPSESAVHSTVCVGWLGCCVSPIYTHWYGTKTPKCAENCQNKATYS